MWSSFPFSTYWFSWTVTIGNVDDLTNQNIGFHVPVEENYILKIHAYVFTICTRLYEVELLWSNVYNVRFG